MIGHLQSGAVQRPLTSLQAFSPRAPVDALLSRAPHATRQHRRALQCHAAASGYSAEQLAVPDGEYKIPLVTDVANTLEWLTDYEAFYRKRFQKYGGLFTTYVLFNPMVVVTDETEVRRLLQAEHKLVESAWPESMRKLFGPNAVLVAPAATHKKQRQILSQAFTDGAMRMYLPIVLDVVRRTLQDWSACSEPIKFYSATRSYAFDIAATVLTGTRFDGEQLVRLREDFDTYSDGLFSLPFNLPGTPFAKALKAREVIVEQIAQLVRAAQASMASGEKLDPKRRNSLQLLLDAQDENGEKLTMEQLQDQILTQLFAGHETTGATLASLLPELQKQPRIMERLRQEQAELVQRMGPDITYEALEAMPYADAVLREVMRAHGIVDGLWRRALEDLEVQGRRVPKGWTVQLMVKRAGLAMPEFAADSGRFRPERWLGEDGRPIKDPKGFMPFGEALLAKLARGYAFELEDPNEAWFQGFKPVNGLPGRVRALEC